MSIFKRQDQGDAQQTITAPNPEASASGGQLDSSATATPPFVSPGVVPPPAAPMYSMRPSESTLRVEADAEISLGDRRATEAQQTAREMAHEAALAAAQRARRRRPPRPGHRTFFDPVVAAQTGLLNLAWRWQRAGAPIRAIHTYMELLERYPHTPAAAAAVADLVELSEKLAHEGQFHTALGIYDQLEELLA